MSLTPTLDVPSATSRPSRAREATQATPAPERGGLLGAAVLGLTNALLLILVHVVSLSPLGAVYASGYVVPLLGVVVVGTALGSIGRFRPLPFWASPLLFVIAALVMVGAVVSDDALLGVLPTPASVGDVLTGATSGWKDLLTVGSPAAASGSLLAGPLTAAFASAWLAAELSHRVRSAAVALIPPLLLWAVCLGLGGPREGFALAWAALGLATCLANLAFRAAVPSSGERRTIAQPVSASWALTAVPLVLGLTVIGAVLGATLPLRGEDADRADLRDLVDPPVSVRDLVTPLAALAPQLEGDADAVLFTVSLSGPGAEFIDRMSIATLDSYDGAVWRNTSSFPRPGEELSEDSTFPGLPLRADVELAEVYRTSFLPNLGLPISYEGADLGFDPATNTLVAGPEVRAFGIEAEVLDPAVTGPLLDRANALASESAERFLAVPEELPESLMELARTAEAASDTTTGRLTALADALADRGYNPQARSSHTLARLDAYVAGSDDEYAAEVGTAEQGAAAFVLAARQLGVPARLAVGYRLGAADDGVVSVAPTDAHAWGEVLLADVGWVSFDPAPTSFQALDDETAPAIGPSDDPGDETDLEEPGLEESPDAELAAPVAATEAEEPDAGPPWLLILVMLVIVGVVAGPPVLKLLRRRQRRSGDESARVLGAAAELRDRLLERGLPASGSLTVHELIDEANARLSPDAANAGSALAPITDLALYSPDGAAVVDASRAWELERDFESALGDGLVASLRHRWDPRPLVVRGGRPTRSKKERAGAGA